MNWQPIATAPRDLNDVLLFWPFQGNKVVIGARNYRVSHDGEAIIYENSWWMNTDHDRFIEDAYDPGPTHWMPLPDPPARDGAAE